MKRTSTIERNAQTSLHLRKGLHVVRISSHERTLRDFNKTLLFLTAFTAFGALIACDGGDEIEQPNMGGTKLGSQNGASCLADTVRYPTKAADFADGNLLYGNRDFLSEYNGVYHLGHDAKLPAGTAVHPIACGKLVYYGPAQGYGTLVAAIEHELDYPITVVNGDGAEVLLTKYLSIYGHGTKVDPLGRGQTLNWQAGQIVQPDDTLMYIQVDADNGDGPEHLHLGIRVQSESDAKISDGGLWLRGNDDDGNYKKFFTDPAVFIPALANHFGVALEQDTTTATISHHPIGTILYDADTGRDWLVVEEDQILDVSGYQTLPRACRINASSEELSCYRIAAFHAILTEFDATVIKFDGLPEVYRLYPGGGFDATGYQVFLSYESFLSWGYRDSDLLHYPASEKQELISALPNKGGVGLMPGALVKGFGTSEVSVANQHGTRRPIFSWDLFQKLGYSANCVYEVEPSTLDVVAGVKSNDLITDSSSSECPAQGSLPICSPGSVIPCSCGSESGTQSCLDDGKSFGPCMCNPGPGGGTGEYCNPPGAKLPCDEICTGGAKECLADNTFGECICPEAGTGGGAGASGSGGAGGSSGASGTGGVGGSSGTGDTSNTGGTSGTGGSGGGGTGGTSGTGGASGSSGTGGSSDSPVTVTLEYNGPSWSNPVFEAAWGSRAYGQIDGCPAGNSGYTTCTVQIPEGVLGSMYWQVSLGMNRYWGDTSGNAPAPCIPAGQLASYYGTSVTIIGTVSLQLNGAVKEFGLCSNGVLNSNYSNICGESQFPYMNGCLNP